jgi:hypothetical protein
MKKSNVEVDHKGSFLVVVHDFGDPDRSRCAAGKVGDYLFFAD